MLLNIKELYGHKIAALDGDIGHVTDFYFDDKSWVIRNLVVDTGSWLPGRLVLLSPHAFGNWDTHNKTLHVNLKKQQIKNSPPIETHKPVSRQYEVEFYKYYGWPAYWNGGAIWGLGGYPVILPPSKDEMEAHLEPHHHRDDRHLQSTQAIADYRVQAQDEEIGDLNSFLVNDRSWEIRDLVVETGPWYAGKIALIPHHHVERISYDDSKVFINITKAAIEEPLENNLVRASERNTGADNFGTLAMA